MSVSYGIDDIVNTFYSDKLSINFLTVSYVFKGNTW